MITKYVKSFTIITFFFLSYSIKNVNFSSKVTKLEKIENKYNLPPVSEYIKSNESFLYEEKHLNMESKDIEEYKSILSSIGFTEEVTKGKDGQQHVYIYSRTVDSIKISITDSIVTNVYISVSAVKQQIFKNPYSIKN